MKVNYQERIDLSVGELKVILSQQRTITNRQKIQALYWLKAGLSPSLTAVTLSNESQIKSTKTFEHQKRQSGGYRV